MFRQFVSKGYRFHRLYSQSAYASQTRRSGLTSPIVVSSTVIATTLLWYSTTKAAHADAPASDRVIKDKDESSMGLSGPNRTLEVVVWGSNRCVALQLRLRAERTDWHA